MNSYIVIIVGIVIGVCLCTLGHVPSERIQQDTLCDVLCKSKGFTKGYMSQAECFGGECVCDSTYGIWEGYYELSRGEFEIIPHNWSYLDYETNLEEESV